MIEELPPPIPEFLNRLKGNVVSEEEQPKEVTLEMILEQIKKLSAKKEEIQKTLSGLKKQAQRMIGGI